MRITAIVVALAVVAPSAPAAASAALIPPVDGTVIARFVEPEHRYAPGHRGLDYAATRGSRVRAAAAGVVRYAGLAGDTRAVTIDHGGGLQTTYSHLEAIEVSAGDELAQGAWVGTTGQAHPNGIDGIHLGVRLNGSYVDPAALLASDVSDAIRLAPLVWQPPVQMPYEFRSAFAHAGTATGLCRPVAPLRSHAPVPPNPNVAVAVAGLSSSTQDGVHADMYEHGPEELGYRANRIYRFSYAGVDGSRLHKPYRSSDTYGDISVAAHRLKRLLVRIARRHPDRDVDILAHSMGGLVARRFLSRVAKQASAPLPRIDHFVTFSTPHQGAALAELPGKLDAKTLTGGWLVDGMSELSQRGLAIPDPRSTAVAQLRAGSPLLDQMGRESVLYGTKVLALAIPNDLIVTADRSSWSEATARVVPPEGLHGHSAIVASDAAQGLAYAFLRDAPASCEGMWDLWGPRIGTALGFAESQSYRGLSALEELAVGRFVRAGKLGYKLAKGRLGQVTGKAIGKLVHRSGVAVRNRVRKEPPPPGGMGG